MSLDPPIIETSGIRGTPRSDVDIRVAMATVDAISADRFWRGAGPLAMRVVTSLTAARGVMLPETHLKELSMALSIGVSVGGKVFVGDSVVTVRAIVSTPKTDIIRSPSMTVLSCSSRSSVPWNCCPRSELSSAKARGRPAARTESRSGPSSHHVRFR
jgi:hypothetical protein